MVFLRYLVRTGFHKGLRGHRVWLWTGVGAYGLVAARRLVRNREEIIFLGELKPGAGIEVRTHAPRSKEETKQLRRSGQSVPRSARRSRRTITLSE